MADLWNRAHPLFASFLLEPRRCRVDRRMFSTVNGMTAAVGQGDTQSEGSWRPQRLHVDLGAEEWHGGCKSFFAQLRARLASRVQTLQAPRAYPSVSSADVSLGPEHIFQRGRPLTGSMYDRSLNVRRELLLSYVGIGVTLIASLVALGGMTLSAARAIAWYRWDAGIGQALFLAIVAFLVYGGLVYQLTRVGHLRRLMAHRPAGEKELRRFFHRRHGPGIAILVPSYKEDPRVVRRTLLSAALQDYPRRRLVLLIDDPPTPTRSADIDLLLAARDLPREIQEFLEEPAQRFSNAL